MTDGPYGIVRHPGYVGALLMMVSSGFALGSWWAMALLVVPVGLILRRAAHGSSCVALLLPAFSRDVAS